MIDCDRSADAADEADTRPNPPLRPQTRQALDEIVSELQQRYSERGGFISSVRKLVINRLARLLRGRRDQADKFLRKIYPT